MSDPIMARLFWAFIALAVVFVVALTALACSYVTPEEPRARNRPRRRHRR